MDLDEFLQQTASGDRFGRRAGGKRQLALCSHKTQDQFAIAFMAKEKLLHCCIGAHARVHMHFLRRVSMHSQVLLNTMHLQVCTLDRCCEHQRTPLLHALYGMCICMHVCAVCFIWHWEMRMGDIQDLPRTLRASVAQKSVACIRQKWSFWLRALTSAHKKTLACIRFRDDPCVLLF